MSAVQLAELKAKFIRKAEKANGHRLSIAERKLFEKILEKFILKLEVSNGNIVSNGANLNLTASLDKIFSEFQKSEYTKVIRQFSVDLLEVGRLSKTYFEVVKKDQALINKIAPAVNKVMEKRIGINSKGEIAPKGFLDKLIKDEALKKQIKKDTYKAITEGKSLTAYINKAKGLIEGSKGVNGGLTKHFNTFAKDTFSQFNRATAKEWASKLDLKAFLYAGTKIDTTRCFCLANVGKVFTVEEAKKWTEKLNKDCGPIWSEKTDGQYKPLEMLGGHNCYHSTDYISETTAVKLRPELAKVLG